MASNTMKRAALLTDRYSTDWEAQPYFMVEDASYGRMLRKLLSGERFVWSYVTKCRHGGTHGRCDCPKMMNVLKNGRIVRIANGKQKPVYKASEIMQMNGSPPEIVVNITNGRMESEGKSYVEGLKTRPMPGNAVYTAVFHLDLLGQKFVRNGLTREGVHETIDLMWATHVSAREEAEHGGSN